MIPDYTLFEQPVNEHIRGFLRLENLSKQILHGIKNHSLWDSRLAVAGLLDALALLDRTDLKTKLTKELRRILTLLNKIERSPQVDYHKLSSLLIEIEDAIDILIASHGRIGEPLRENEFLSNLRNYLSTAGGAFSFDAPAFYLWLQQPAEKRMSAIAEWFKHFEAIISAVNLFLTLIRESCAPQMKLAIQGFFQSNIDPQAPCHLIRVGLPTESHIYPEISVGRHGLAIRFYTLSLEKRPAQIKSDLPFKLTICSF